MKVLTIKQPWASLIMLGYKRFEFRSWKTNYRGELLIHAGQGIDKEAMKRLQKYISKDMPKGKILGKEKVEKLECIKTELVKKEGENRLSPVNIEGSNFILDMDYVVMATGSKPENNIIEKFEKNEYGYIKIDENMQTSISKVFAGGDIVGQKATVAWAARSGRDAAEKILKITCNIM